MSTQNRVVIQTAHQSQSQSQSQANEHVTHNTNNNTNNSNTNNNNNHTNNNMSTTTSKHTHTHTHAHTHTLKSRNTHHTHKKVLSSKLSKRFAQKRKRTGVVYMSRIPPFMSPTQLRNIFEQFGLVGRLFLTPEGPRNTLLSACLHVSLCVCVTVVRNNNIIIIILIKIINTTKSTQ